MFPVIENISDKMVNFIRKEIAKEGFDGLDAKDVMK